MNKIALAMIAGLVMVLTGLVILGDVEDCGDLDASGSDDVVMTFEGKLTIGGETKQYNSFELAIEDANKAGKKIIFASDASFNKKGTYTDNGGNDDYKWYDVSGLTIDLAGYNVDVQRKMALILGGSDFTVCNGSFTTRASYALFVGDDEETRSNVTLTDLKMNGGINICNVQNVKLNNLSVNVDITENPYYAVWCEGGSTAEIEGGNYDVNQNCTSVLRGTNNSTLKVNGGIFGVPKGLNLVAIGGDYSMQPEIVRGFFYGEGMEAQEISKYVPSGYHVIESTYGEIQGLEVVPEGTLVSVKMNVQGNGSVNSMGLKVLEGTSVSIEDNLLEIGDCSIIATALSKDYEFVGWLGVPEGTITSDVTITALFMKVDGNDQMEVDTDSAKILIEKTGGMTSITSEIKVDGVADVNTAITGTLDEIAEVQKASQTSSGNVAVQVVVPVSGEKGTLGLSNTTVIKLKESGAELKVNNDGMTVSLETKIIETLAAESEKQSSDMLSIVVTPNTKELSDEQKMIVMENQAVDVSAYLGEKKISDLGGTARISVPYQTDNKVKVTYVKDDGTTEDVDCTYVDGIVSFTTTHFSVFMISEVKSPTFIIIPDTSQDDFPGYVPTPSSDSTDSGSGDTARIAVLVGAIVVLLVALVALTHKTR